jgi:hypothetical protein
LKAEKECTEGQLDELAETTLKQINDRQYHVEMSTQGVKEIFYDENTETDGRYFKLLV